jgi:hypothetical protein
MFRKCIECYFCKIKDESTTFFYFIRTFVKIF